MFGKAVISIVKKQISTFCGFTTHVSLDGDVSDSAAEDSERRKVLLQFFSFGDSFVFGLAVNDNHFKVLKSLISQVF